MGGDSSRVKASSLSTSSFSSSASSSLAHGTATGFVTGGVTAPGLGSTVFGSGNTRSRNFAMYEQGDDDVIVQTEKSESSTEWYTYQTSYSHGNIAGDGTVAVSESRRRRGSDAIAWLIAMFFSILSAAYTTYLLYSTNKGFSWFAYHPPLQMASLACLTYGILTLQPTNHPKTKAAGLVRHQLAILLTALPLLAVGTWTIYHNKNLGARPHFVSWHGKLGIAACAWLCTQTLFGCLSTWFGGAALGGGMKAKSYWKFHRLSGYLLYPLFVYAAHLGGAWSTYTNAHASHIMRLVAYSIGPIITVIAVYSRIRVSKMKLF